MPGYQSVTAIAAALPTDEETLFDLHLFHARPLTGDQVPLVLTSPNDVTRSSSRERRRCLPPVPDVPCHGRFLQSPLCLTVRA